MRRDGWSGEGRADRWRAILADTALHLGHRLGTGPRLWLNLQQAYELDLTEQAPGRKLQAIERRRLSRWVRRLVDRVSCPRFSLSPLFPM
jgi:hypothetical protein